MPTSPLASVPVWMPPEKLPLALWLPPRSLPLPPLSFPGAIIGLRQVEELGEVEFLASDTKTMLLVATPQKVYAISPEDTRGFVRTFQIAMEMGSITPLTAYSAEPAAFARRVYHVILYAIC